MNLIIPLCLGVLAFIDGTLCGFRSAAGRNPRIFMWHYYRAAFGRGAAFAAVTVLAFSVVAVGLVLLGPEGTWASLLESATVLVHIYGAFATLTLIALGLYLIGSFDFGVLASVLVLGPFTLLRPWTIMLGAIYAAATATTVIATVFSLAAGVVMWNFERLLDVGSPPWRGLEGDRRRA
ncbi:MAG: hypothetical protein JNM17_07380 [Archangium sp.]|nr:hypothetical protein [Archangium sp.]